MTTTLESAKQGDPQALAALMNKTLQPQGLNARVAKQGQLLRVLVQGEQPPDQVKVVGFISSGIKKLGVQGVDELEVLGQQAGINRPTWSQKVPLIDSPSPLPSSPAEVETPSKSVGSANPARSETSSADRIAKATIIGIVPIFTFLWILGALENGTFSSWKRPEVEQSVPVAPAPQRVAVQSPTNRKMVSSSLLDAEWMLTVQAGELVCERPNTVIFITRAGAKYAVNGTAESRGYPNIRPIWKDNPDIPGAKISIGPLIEEGLKLCQ